jgi:hypothetical protein
MNRGLDWKLLGFLSKPGTSSSEFSSRKGDGRRTCDGTLLGTFPAGHRPFGILFDGTYIWVADPIDNTVTKLRASAGSITGTFPLGDIRQVGSVRSLEPAAPLAGARAHLVWSGVRFSMTTRDLPRGQPQP